MTRQVDGQGGSGLIVRLKSVGRFGAFDVAMTTLWCLALISACGQTPDRAQQWFDQRSFPNGSRVVKIDHPKGVDAVEAIVDLPAPVDSSGICHAIGDPPGCSESPAAGRPVAPLEHPDRGSVTSVQVARVVDPPGTPGGCKTAVWGLEPAGGGSNFNGVFLDVGCG